MDQERDIERGTGPSTPAQFDHGGYSNKSTEATLQELLKELNEFLGKHSGKIHSLRDLPPGSVGQHQSSSHMKSGLKIDTSEPEVSEEKLTTQFRDAPFTSSPVEAHKDHIGEFLQSHVDNVESLLRNLKSSLSKPSLPPKYQTVDEKKTTKQDTPVPCVPRTISPTSIGHEALEALTEQFNMLVVISTFTASLIVSFIQLVKDVMQIENRLAFDVGMLLSFLAMGVHFGNIIVAGRGAALTSQHGAMSGENGYDAKYFGHYLELCEQLQFAATILFISSIILLSFFIFSKFTFPIILLVLSSLWAGLVFWRIYWRVSITVRDVKFVARWAKRKFSTQAG